MMQTSLSERVDYLKRVIAASRERQRSCFALNYWAKRNGKNTMPAQKYELARVIREAERDILRLKEAN